MKQNLRLLYINIAITIGLIAGVNFLSNLILFLSPKIGKVFSGKKSEVAAKNIETQIADFGSPEDFAKLPNYANDRDLAKLHFEEYGEKEVQYEAFIAWRHKQFKGKTININANGERFHDLGSSNQSDRKKAYFFGGSTMWGLGVFDNQTIPAWFHSISGIPSSNQGELGYTSRQSIARLTNLMAQEAPIEMVVFYDGVNDVVYNCLSYLNVNEHSRSQTIRKLFERSRGGKTKKTSNEFSRYLELVFVAGTKQLAKQLSTQPSESNKEQDKEKKKQTKVDKSHVCDNSQERALKSAEILVNNWEIAHDMAEANGIEFWAVLQPVPSIGKPKLDHLKFNQWHQERLLQYETVYPIIQEIIKQRGHKWILDYTDAFSRDEYIYIDFVHASENGNEIIAKKLYNDIIVEQD